MPENNSKPNQIKLKQPFCIGIGGVSRSGKTFLATFLNHIIPSSIIINQDMYIPDESEIPRIKGHTDWERPEAIDWQKLKLAIYDASKNGKTVIVEGLLVFNHDEINALYSKKIFIELSRSEFIKRKKLDQRWGLEPDWYIDHIWESYLKYGRIPEEFNEVLILNGEQDFDFDKILQYINPSN